MLIVQASLSKTSYKAQLRSGENWQRHFLTNHADLVMMIMVLSAMMVKKKGICMS